MLLFPPAKINLGLLILGKYPNGYHQLETLMVAAPALRDRLELVPASGPGCTFELSGIPLDGSTADNLCVRAYNLLAEAVPDLPGVTIRLEKGIPAGAGLGGGSADAAHTLRGINELFGLNLPVTRLHDMAARLGADVPFFLYDQPMLASGTGTTLEPFPLDLPFRLHIETPPIHSATMAAYKGLNLTECDPGRSLRHLLAQPVALWRDVLVNDLEQPVFRMYPELAEIKARLYAEGAIYAAMSGSGSAVFGLFPQ